MSGVVSGFFTIWVVIGAGWLAAHLRVLSTTGQEVLAKVAFFIASPALLFVIVAESDVSKGFSTTFAVNALAALAAMGLFLVVGRAWLKLDNISLLMGATASGYVNAANLGIPIALFVLNNIDWLPPLLLLQVAVLQPLVLTLLDIERSRSEQRKISMLANLTLPLRNPMTLGVLAGLIVNVADIRVPELVLGPVRLLGDMSVPAMLVAFGISLRLGPLPGRGENTRAAVVASLIKLVVHPVIALLLALAFGLDRFHTLVAMVVAGLPTAQNVFVWAVRYGRAVVLVRDTVFITTIGSILTVGLIAVLGQG
ncbi:AEC family transporter [Propionibacteriaceae bacterium G1746]|uniref:AEC family transporter n=1 Tax=Aestuariimicrobium sp. G57 TaxID=3418485 RepID=UPI003C2796F2